MDNQMNMSQEALPTTEQRQAMVEARYDVIDALQKNLGPLTDRELAARTLLDVAAVRETLTDLADNLIVEITYQVIGPPGQMTGRLVAL